MRRSPKQPVMVDAQCVQCKESAHVECVQCKDGTCEVSAWWCSEDCFYEWQRLRAVWTA